MMIFAKTINQILQNLILDSDQDLDKPLYQTLIMIAVILPKKSIWTYQIELLNFVLQDLG